MKKTIALILCLCMLLCCFVGCGPTQHKEITLTVFAAASLTECMEELRLMYMEEHPELGIICNYDSSGTLKTQIQEGAVCDLFLSAAEKQMDELGDAVLTESRLALLENRICLVVPKGNPVGITGFEDLIEGLRAGEILLSMGNSDVPAGQYGERIFDYFGIIPESVSAGISYGSNVKEIATQVLEGTADCGIVYQTDAAAAGLTVVDTATVEMCGQVLYPAAVLKTSGNRVEAQAFLDFLTTDTADAVFAAAGFTPLG